LFILFAVGSSLFFNLERVRDIVVNGMSFTNDGEISSNIYSNLTFSQSAPNDTNHDPMDLMVKDDSIDRKVKDKLQLLQSSEPDCFCPNGRKNWIYYTSCPGRGGKNFGAGIKDRQNILRRILWYADELCAKVALLCHPNDWLSEAHGCYAPKTAEWSSYFATVRKSFNGTSLSKVDILHWDVDEKNEKEVFHGLRYIEGPPTVEKYNLGTRLHAKDKPFVWEFNVSYWKSELRKHKRNLSHREYNDTCGVIDFDPSEELLGIARFAMNELGLAFSQDFVTLHLRRGDYRKCNTDIDTVMKYLHCSIGTDNVTKVVVLTNENEQQYLNDLHQNFTRKFPDMEMILLDQFITSETFVDSLVQKNLMKRSGAEYLKDNCFFFSAEKVLVSMARYHLERGHTHCSKCDKGGIKTAPLKAIIR